PRRLGELPVLPGGGTTGEGACAEFFRPSRTHCAGAAKMLPQFPDPSGWGCRIGKGGVAMRFFLPTIALVFAVPMADAAATSRYERALMKLSPEERAQQACVAKGLETIRRDGRLRRVDRVMPDTFGRARFKGSA